MTKAALRAVAVLLLFTTTLPAQESATTASPSWSPGTALLLRGTVVTMDGSDTILKEGNVLVRNSQIAAVWNSGAKPPGVSIGDARVIDLGPKALIFPGMINLHDHPTYSMLPTWLAPSSHVQGDRGRPMGKEPYANRYQWNIVGATSPPEYRRLVDLPQFVISAANALDMQAEAVKYAEIRALLGGQTSVQGSVALAATDDLLARNVDNTQFGRDRIESRVASIASLTGSALTGLLSRMQSGQVDAWLVHLAEGVRDGDRRAGDTTSSRGEFATLKSKGLLTDATVIVHGTALEPADFTEMRLAPSIRTSGQGDGLGAKLVWSPLSNLLLYGKTTNVYQALAAGVLVSLGTDWSPSGSRNLLAELKVADRALRDVRILGGDRELVPEFAIRGRSQADRVKAEIALDRMLVSMVTRNPARTLRWTEAGSIESGKAADLFVVVPRSTGAPTIPGSVYRSLIDADERDVALVLVGGEPLAGDLAVMQSLKGSDTEVVTSACGGWRKAVDATRAGVPKGDQPYSVIRQRLATALEALGGDNPPAEGGQADETNTYSWLKANIPLPFPMTDAQFREMVLIPTAGMANGKLNAEKISMPPLLTADDDFLLDVLSARLDGVSGLVSDPTPPYKLYPANLNHLQNGENPFAAQLFERKWYAVPFQRAPLGHCQR